MARLRVGTKVRIIGRSEYHGFNIGDVGKIVAFPKGQPRAAGEYEVGQVPGVSYTQTINIVDLEVVKNERKSSKHTPELQ